MSTLSAFEGCAALPWMPRLLKVKTFEHGPFRQTTAENPVFPSSEREQAHAPVTFCKTRGSHIGAVKVPCPFETELRREGFGDKDAPRRRHGHDAGGKGELRAENRRC